MKVRHTFVLDDDVRMGIAIEKTGHFRLATREECEAWLEDKMADHLLKVKRSVNEVREQILEGLGAEA